MATAALLMRVLCGASCAYALAGGQLAGVVLRRYPSANWARKCDNEQEQLLVNEFGPRAAHPIPGLGSWSASVAMRGTGALAAARFGARTLTVAIYWAPAAANPGLAVAMLRIAVKHLGDQTGEYTIAC